MTVGEMIRQLREEQGLSQTKLAATADISAATLSQFETGRKTPSLGSLLRLADALGVEPGELLPPKALAPSKSGLPEATWSAEGLTDEQLAQKLRFQQGVLDGDLRRWKKEVEDVEEGRMAVPEQFGRDMTLKTLGVLHDFDKRRGMEMLETATQRVRSGTLVSPELRQNARELYSVVAELLELGQKASAASHRQADPSGQTPPPEAATVTSLEEYRKRIA